MSVYSDVKSSRAQIPPAVLLRPRLLLPSPVSWVFCREEGSLLSKQSLNGDNRGIVSPVGHRVIFECHPLRQLTRGLAWENQPRIFRRGSRVSPFLITSDAVLRLLGLVGGV